MNKCGECKSCCEFFLITLEDVPDDYKKFCRTWGVLMEEQGSKTLLKIYSPCQHLTTEGCAIYKGRSQYCKDFKCNELRAGKI